jgi:cell division protein ZapE
MQGVHEGLRSHRDEVDPLAAVATDLAARSRLICLDELFVSDIADAMLLAGLFTHLVDRGVTLVFTSNVPPSGLYRDGLQRQRFLPAIALIERHCEVVCVDGGTDYRLRHLTRAPIYLQSDAAHVERALAEIFEDLADGAGHSGGHLEIEGRPIPVIRLSENVVWFDFKALCEGPRSQDDYVGLAREYQSIVLSDVPIFTRDSEDAARRFIALIDEFYDRRVKLVVSAAAGPSELYRGERLRFEFDRTASRLIEMQSEAYLASAHRG